MKTIIDIKAEKPRKGDVLTFDGEKWVCEGRNSFNSSVFEYARKLEKRIIELEAQNELLKANIQSIKDGANARFEGIYKALDALIEERK